MKTFILALLIGVSLAELYNVPSSYKNGLKWEFVNEAVPQTTYYQQQPYYMNQQPSYYQNQQYRQNYYQTPYNPTSQYRQPYNYFRATSVQEPQVFENPTYNH